MPFGYMSKVDVQLYVVEVAKTRITGIDRRREMMFKQSLCAESGDRWFMAANRFWAGDASHSHRRQYSVMQMGWRIASMRLDGGSQIRAGTWAWQPETRRLPGITDVCRGCFVVWQMCFSSRRSGLNETNVHRCPWMLISIYRAVIKAQSRRETNDIRLIVSSFRHSMRIRTNDSAAVFTRVDVHSRGFLYTTVVNYRSFHNN